MNYASTIPNLEIHWTPAPYQVLNERAIRASAWLMFAVWLSTIWYSVLTHDRSVMHIVVPLFWLHFFIATVFAPRFSPVAWIGKLLTSGQRPEYVWAIQKRFARGLGLFMATLMMLAVFVFHAPSYVLLSICGTCLLFMWLESAVWLCVGCKIYRWLVHAWWLPDPEHKPACPWWACPIPKRK